MTEETTTIEITEAQANELREIGGEQAYKHTVAELIDAYESDAPETFGEKLDKTLRAAKAAENAAQTTQATVEEITSQ